MKFLKALLVDLLLLAAFLGVHFLIFEEWPTLSPKTLLWLALFGGAAWLAHQFEGNEDTHEKIYSVIEWTMPALAALLVAFMVLALVL